MLRRQVPLLLAVGWIGLLFAAASVLTPMAAARYDALTLTEGVYELQNPVEQDTPFICETAADGHIWCHFSEDRSTWVTNPLRCVWDPDDTFAAGAQHGYLEPGRTLTATVCTVADGEVFHAVRAHVWANTDTLTVTMDGAAIAPVFDRSDRYWHWRSCRYETTGWNTYGPDGFPLIEGSNGGDGIPMTHILTVTGGPKLIRDASATLETWGYHPVERCA